MKTDLLFDTNAFIAASQQPGAVAHYVQRARTLNIAFVSVGELYFGALNSSEVAVNLALYREQLEDYRILQPTSRTPMIYAQTKLALKKCGLKIPPNDLWIAALAIENDLPLVTRDAHFDGVEGLQRLAF